ncbi:MAG: hypothetical protein DRH08_04580 [Deltaproteobacteria bacterium]|nr:MAG: hypothetical protein DRH08_04580 [Deltaproteobacteria bacterium]
MTPDQIKGIAHMLRGTHGLYCDWSEAKSDEELNYKYAPGHNKILFHAKLRLVSRATDAVGMTCKDSEAL